MSKQNSRLKHLKPMMFMNILHFMGCKKNKHGRWSGQRRRKKKWRPFSSCLNTTSSRPHLVDLSTFSDDFQNFRLLILYSSIVWKRSSHPLNREANKPAVTKRSKNRFVSTVHLKSDAKILSPCKTKPNFHRSSILQANSEWNREK